MTIEHRNPYILAVVYELAPSEAQSTYLVDKIYNSLFKDNIAAILSEIKRVETKIEELKSFFHSKEPAGEGTCKYVYSCIGDEQEKLDKLQLFIRTVGQIHPEIKVS